MGRYVTKNRQKRGLGSVHNNMTDELCNIHSSLPDYSKIAQLYNSHKGTSFGKVHIGLSKWFNANMAAPLGAVLDLLADNLNDVVFDHIDDRIKIILQKNGFLSHFGFANQADSYDTTIQYKKMKPDDGRYFQEYVRTQLIGRPELPNMGMGLRKQMTAALFELFVNAQIHSNTKHIYTCGQFFPNRHTIEFCIVDTGVGFKQKFFQRFNKNISSINAIRWAVEDKNTTKADVSGGIGLAILREFIKHNNGKLQIISHDGFYQYDGSSEQTGVLEVDFPGVLVNVLFRTDDPHHYSLAHEYGKTDLADLF